MHDRLRAASAQDTAWWFVAGFIIMANILPLQTLE